MTEQLDTQGEAREALSSMVSDYSKRILSDPRMLGNIVTDLLPDLPRERSLLVTAAEADVAGDLTRHVEENHLDADTAVSLVARSLSERRAIDTAASTWVTSEYAQALGYRVRSVPAPPPPPPADPTTPAYGRYGNQQTAPAPGAGAEALGGYSQPQAGNGGYVPPQPGPGGQAPTGVPPQSPPPWAPPTPPPKKKRNLAPILAAGGTALVVVIYFAVAAAAGIAPFSKSHASPTSTPTHPPTSHKPPPSSSPPPTLAAGVTPLTQLVPSDIADPTTQCSPIKKLDWSSPGLVASLSCTDTGLPNGFVYGYQMDNHTDYTTTWQNFNSWSSFDESSAGSSCPPPSSGKQGITTWWNNKDGFPEVQGQVVECWTGSNAAPIFVWSMPTQDAFFFAVGADGSSFQTLTTWWENNSAPANAPPSPSASA